MTEIVETTIDSTVIVENTDTNVVEVTAAGPAGGQGPAGLGLPVGGTLGQILVKASATDYDTYWSSVLGLGTVTSVDLTAPTGFTVTGGPITTSGTLAISFAAGYSLPSDAEQTNWDTAYSWGNHALAGYAHAGANSDITSMTGITGGIGVADYVQFDTAAAATGAVGKLLWNDADGTLEFQAKGGNVTIQIGQEQIVHVTNQSGTTMIDGQAVYITGSTGNHLNVTLAQANSEVASSKTLAVITETIANNTSGFATTSGLVHGLNTSALTEGAAIWLSPTVAGGLTTVKPQAPDHSVLIGWCVKQHATVGVIYVHVANGYEIDELHDVKITGTISAGSLLIRNATDSLWENARLTAGTGISIGNADKSITVTNTAPDQVVSITGSGTTNVTGTYPNFTVSSSDQYVGTVTSVGATAGAGISVTGGPITSAGTFTITNTAPDQVVSLTAGSNVTISGTYPDFTIAATGGGGGSGTVTSVGATVPTGFTISGSPITTSGTLAIGFATGYSLPTTASQANWDTAYTDRLKWDGTSVDLVAATGRTSLGATTLGANLFTIVNPSAVTFPRFNADNTVSALDAATFRTAIGAGVGSVTSVSATVPTGFSITGSPITSSGTLAIGFATGYSLPTDAAQANWNTAYGWGNHASAGYLTSAAIGTTVQAYDADLTTWGAKTAPSGTVVGTTDTQTLTNKTLTGTQETPFTISDGASVDINPANGGFQTWTLGASRTPTATSFANGQSVTLLVDDGTAYAITWSSIGVTWLDGASAPTLQTSGYTIIELFKLGGVVYGMGRR